MAQRINADHLKASFARVEELAASNKSLADQVRAGIRAFERRLQTLNGRVAARVGGDDSDRFDFVLAFTQHGSEWKLVFVDRRPATGKCAGVHLTDAGEDAQIRAVPALPALLDEMVRAHERRGAELEPALRAISDLGITGVGLYSD